MANGFRVSIRLTELCFVYVIQWVQIDFAICGFTENPCVIEYVYGIEDESDQKFHDISF